MVPDFPGGDTANTSHEEPLIFVSDASAEAERLTSALRARGYVVVDVPLALLVGRVSVQRPALILCDVDAPGALDHVRRLRDVPFGAQVDIIFLGEPGRTLDAQRDEVFHESSGFFVRPVDAFGLLRKVEALIGAPKHPPLGARLAVGPSSRPPLPPLSGSSPPPRPSTKPSAPAPRQEPSAAVASPSSPAASPSSPAASPSSPAASPSRPVADGSVSRSSTPTASAVPGPEQEAAGARASGASAGAERRTSDTPPPVPRPSGLAAEAPLPSSPRISEAPDPRAMSTSPPPRAATAEVGSADADAPPEQRSTTPPRARRSPIPSSVPSSVPVRSTGPSSFPLSEPSLPQAVPLGFTNDDRAASPLARHIPQSEISAELEGILARAEQRVGAANRGSAPVPPSLRMAPEAEVDAVLPADVLAALDEPLELDEDEASDSGTGTGGSTGGSVRTGFGTGAGSMAGSMATGTGSTGHHALPLSPKWSDSAHSEAETGVGEEEAPATPPAVPTRPPLPGSWPPAASGPIMTAVESRPTSGHIERDGPPTAIARPTPLPPSLEPRPGSGPGVPERMLSAPEPAAPAAPKAPATPEIPAVLRAGDAALAIARAIRSRFTGAIAFENDQGIRRVVLRDGDFVTAASGIANESLVAYLAERGTFGPDVAKSLGHKLPPFGRHAGAALIAHGHLRQDELWPVLRSHAEWLVGVIVTMDSGGASLERAVPARLEAEPAVFGGATGAEVFVEIVRRVVAPDTALALLGGPRTRLMDGQNASLLGECALGQPERELVNRCKSSTLGEVSSPQHDFVTVLWALSLLGVLEPVGPVQAVPPRAKEAAPKLDSFDERAQRTRILARRALVEEGDYFALLGVSREATSYDIQRAYADLRREFEPSRILTAGTADLRADVDLILEVLEEAFEILGHPQRRERYRRAVEATPS